MKTFLLLPAFEPCIDLAFNLPLNLSLNLPFNLPLNLYSNKWHNISNTDFYAGDIKNLLNEDFLGEHGRPDVVITDPPRAGMHEDVCKMLLQASPERIVYVSCNAATQARDLKILAERYSITSVQPVDMFPHTVHVENVVSLVRMQV